MDLSKDIKFQNRLLLLNASLPLLLVVYDWQTGQIGPNPPEAILRTTGVLALVFLVLCLSVTPMVKIFKISWLIRHRRNLGLLSFFYGGLHLLCYSIFDKGLKFSEIFIDIKKRPFILLGVLAFTFMVPLAVTSTNEMIKKLGRSWKTLHKLTYLIAIAAVAHYWLIVKSDLFYPILFCSIVSMLFFYRILKFLRGAL